MAKEKNLRITVYVTSNPKYVVGMLSKEIIDVPFDMDIRNFLRQIGAKGITEWGNDTAYNKENKTLTQGHLKANQEYKLEGIDPKKFGAFQKKYNIGSPEIPGTNFILPKGKNLEDALSKLVDILHE